MTESLTVGMSAVTWAREHGTHYRGRCATTNHEPHHALYAEAVMDCYSASGHQGEPIWVVVDHGGLIRTDSLFIMDDGQRVEPWYVAGWSTQEPHILLHRFPTNLEADGQPRLRADVQRPVNFDSWMLGPRRAYHVKLRKVA